MAEFNNKCEYHIAHEQALDRHETDIKDLPVDVQPGSTCIVVNPTSVYMLNTKQEWVKL